MRLSTSNDSAQASHLGLWMAVAGAMIQITPVIGIIGVTIGTMLTIAEKDSAQLSVAIGELLVATFIGMLIALVGVVFMLVAIFSFRYRATWLLWFMSSFGVIYLFFSVRYGAWRYFSGNCH